MGSFWGHFGPWRFGGVPWRPQVRLGAVLGGPGCALGAPQDTPRGPRGPQVRPQDARGSPRIAAEGTRDPRRERPEPKNTPTGRSWKPSKTISGLVQELLRGSRGVGAGRPGATLAPTGGPQDARTQEKQTPLLRPQRSTQCRLRQEEQEEQRFRRRLSSSALGTPPSGFLVLSPRENMGSRKSSKAGTARL